MVRSSSDFLSPRASLVPFSVSEDIHINSFGLTYNLTDKSKPNQQMKIYRKPNGIIFAKSTLILGLTQQYTNAK